MANGAFRASGQRPGRGPLAPGGRRPRPALPTPAARSLLAAALFPVALPAMAPSAMTLPPGGDAPRGRRLAGAAVQVAGAAAGAVVLLLRVGRIPAWDSPYAEDNGEFLIGALRHPWRLLAVAALAGVLGFGWVTDFRYATERTYTGYWQVTAWHWLHECTLSPTGTITVPVWQAAPGPVDCARCAAEPLRRRAHPGRPPALYTLMPK